MRSPQCGAPSQSFYGRDLARQLERVSHRGHHAPSHAHTSLQRQLFARAEAGTHQSYPDVECRHPRSRRACQSGAVLWPLRNTTAMAVRERLDGLVIVTRLQSMQAQGSVEALSAENRSSVLLSMFISFSFSSSSSNTSARPVIQRKRDDRLGRRSHQLETVQYQRHCGQRLERSSEATDPVRKTWMIRRLPPLGTFTAIKLEITDTLHLI